MARRPRPFFRTRANRFCVKMDGKTKSLGVPGPDTPERRALAEEVLVLFLRTAHPETPLSQGLSRGQPVNDDRLSVAAAVADYLAHCALRHAAGKLSADSLANYRFALAPFVLAFGSRPLCELTSPDGRLEVEAWCAARGWSSSYQYTVLGLAQAAFKRAGVPVTFDRPPVESRGPEVCLSDDQFTLVLANLFRRPSRGDLRELLVLLRETGRRPMEAAGLTAEGLDWGNCCRVAREHKTKRKTGRDALWVFNSAAMAVLGRQRDRHGSGLLFRTAGGLAYNRRLIGKQLQAVSKRVGFRVVAYGLGRHSFATAALEAGVPDVMVAALLGHGSTQMIHKHYSHCNQNAHAMRAAAERVRSPVR